MPKAQETVLEIDLNALAHNFKTIKSQLKPGVKFMSVIKAYAYGNDSVAMAHKLEELAPIILRLPIPKKEFALEKRELVNLF